MPIKAKYNGSYKDITDLMNVDESIDYVLAKTSSSYKRVYTATRSIEDTPPTTFKSIKPGANLTDYRIYGNTSKNILPLSKTPKTETIGDILCEYDGKGTFTFTSNVDNPTYTQDQWFWVPFEEDFDFPVGISDGGHGCIQLNNDFATEYGVTPYFVGFANRDNGEFVSGFNVAGTALNIVDTNYYTEDLEGLPANCIAFQYLQQIGKRTVTIKPALYLDIRTQQPFEPYGESVGDRTANLAPNLGRWIDGYLKQSDGTLMNATSAKEKTSPFIEVNSNDEFTFSYDIGSNEKWASVAFYDENKNFIFRSTQYTAIPFTFIVNIENAKFIRLSSNTFGSEIYPNLNSGSTALPYEPYGYKVPVLVTGEGKNILPMSTTPISTDVDDFHCEYDGAGTITLTTDKDNAVLNNFSIPLSEDFIIPVSVGQGGNGCVQFNNSIAATANSNTNHIWVMFYYNTTFIDIWGLTAINRRNSVYSTIGGKTINRLVIDIKGTAFSTNREIVIQPAFVLNTTEQVPFEPYHAPITTSIYLPEQIRKVGDEAEYVDYAEQKQHRVRKNLFNETLYNKNVEDNTLIYIPIYVGNVNYVTCSTTCPKTISGEYNINNSRYIFILSGNVNTGAQNAVNGVSNDAPRTIQPSNGYVTICYRKIEGYDVRPWEYQTMLNVGSTPLPYEPYIENTELDVTLPALPTVTGTNTLSVGTEVQPSKIDITGHIKTISGGS